MASPRLDSDEASLLDKDGLLESAEDARKRYYDARCKLQHFFFLKKHNQDQLRKELKTTINFLGNDYYEGLLKAAQSVLNSADIAYQAAEENDHTKLADLADALECCEEGIRKPFNSHNFTKLTALSERVDTQPSLGKKIGAGLILFAGLLTVLAFGALVLATKGVALASLPLIGPAITTGLCWLASAATTLGISAEILAFTGLGVGVATTIGGSVLAANGQARGLARSMYCFQNEVNKVQAKEANDSLKEERAALFSAT